MPMGTARSGQVWQEDENMLILGFSRFLRFRPGKWAFSTDPSKREFPFRLLRLLFGFVRNATLALNAGLGHPVSGHI